jgi:hypothetical protein
MGVTKLPQPCKDFDEELKKTHGNDYRTNRKKFPITSETLTALTGVENGACKAYFGYSNLVKEFCNDVSNFESSVGGGKTCKDFDADGSQAKKFCLGKKNPTDSEPRMRKRTELCNGTYLKGKYVETSEEFCKKYPKNSWCKCYNVSNKVCDKSSWNMENAFGCKEVIENLDKNKDFFKDGYDILRENAKCRPRVCDDSSRVYIPEGSLNSCKASYNMCGKDLNIRSMSNSDIVLACNAGMSPSELPDWWENIDKWAAEDDREPPFDKYPWNKLPITRFPKRFRWRDKNVRYLTYASGASVVSCCLCLMLIFSVLTRRR